MSRRPVAPLMFILALLALTTLVTASDVVTPIQRYGDPSQGIEYVLAPGTSLSKPFTIHSRFRFSDERGEPTIWLAGLASEKNGHPDALFLQWVQDATGWFPVWKLRLQTRLDLLTPSQVDSHDGDHALIELTDLRPQAGHEYRTAMSYDPTEEILSLMVEDATAGLIVYATNLKLLPYSGALYPGAGWSVANAQVSSPPVELLEFAVLAESERHGLPLAIMRDFRSMLLEVSQDDGSMRRKLGHEYLKDEPLGLRLEWPAEPVVGEVHVLLAGDDEERLLVAAPWTAEPHDLILEAGALPLGETQLVLEHVHGTHRNEIVRHSLRVIEAKIRVGYTIQGRDYDRDRLVGELTLAPDLGVVEDAELIVIGTYVGEGAASQDPFVVLRHRIEGLDKAVSLPLNIPVPQQSGTLRLEASVTPHHVAVGGGSRQITVKGGDVVSEDSTLFPFVVNPWQESPDNVTNISHWLDRPAGKDGFVTIEGGHFVAGDGSPIRFLGVNCAFAGCFPDHASAEKLARQLARFGINLVRFHHMDMQEAPGGIWRRGTYPRQLDPNQLDRLDYFIYQLKENGIYSNLNLHVSRTMAPQEGFPEPERRPDFDKGLTLFDPDIIAHQKAYARDLLTHRNPYTGNRYVEEPAIAMIEITNENGLILFTQWGGIDALPERYQEALDAQWQQWLVERYETTQALAEAWGGGNLSAGIEIAANGRLDRGLTRWTLETDGPGSATMRVAPREGPAGPEASGALDFEAESKEENEGQAELHPLPALELRVIEKGSVPWRPQVHHVGLDLKLGKLYLVSFWLKSDRPHSITSNLMMHHDPWIGFGSFEPAVTTEWQRFEYAVRIPDSAEVREGRLSFTNLEAGATYWIANLSVLEVEGAGQGLLPGEDLESGVSRPPWQSLGMRSSKVRQDYIEFLWDVEQAYFDEMYRFIKEELGARAPVSGTQVQWSPPGIQAGLDYVDVHAYWNHPDFPGASWDASNWYVRNNSMTESTDGGAIASLARTRVAGKPYIVSEYNHPAPITYSSEAFLLTGAYGAFQDWDGLVAFAWSHDADFWPQRIPNFFDIKSHPTKLVTLPAVAALLLRGDVRPGEQVVYAPLPDEVQRKRLLETTVFGVGSDDGEVPPLTALQHRLALVVDGVDIVDDASDVESAVGGDETDVDVTEDADETVGIDPSDELSGGLARVATFDFEIVFDLQGENEEAVVMEGADRDEAVLGTDAGPREENPEDLPVLPPQGPVLPPQGPVITSDTGELRWERTGANRAVVVVDTERSKAVIGYGGGRTFKLSGVTLVPGRTMQQGWSAITLTVMEGSDFAGPGRILLTATGYVENDGMGWERLEGDTVTVRNRWGEAPSLVEGIPARIELPIPPARLAVYALDGAGNRRQRVPVRMSSQDPGRSVIEIGPRYRTLWYEIEVGEIAEP